MSIHSWVPAVIAFVCFFLGFMAGWVYRIATEPTHQ